MENKALIIDNDSTILINCDENSSQQFLYIVDSKFNVNINLEINSRINSSTTINMLIFSTLDSLTNINITSNSSADFSQVSINAFCFGLDDSKTNLTVSSSVESNAKENKVFQNIFGLILSPTATINGQPILKIQTEQVIAKHSLKIGSLDSQELFYLQTKGFDIKQAKKIIINSMIKNLLNNENDLIYINKIINARI